jgi:hypothetical protein
LAQDFEKRETGGRWLGGWWRADLVEGVEGGGGGKVRRDLCESWYRDVSGRGRGWGHE